jgi:hypothetical protein
MANRAGQKKTNAVVSVARMPVLAENDFMAAEHYRSFLVPVLPKD